MYNILTAPWQMFRATMSQTMAAMYYWQGMYRYVSAFMSPSINALDAFARIEPEKMVKRTPAENLADYGALMEQNLQASSIMVASSLKAMNNFFYSTTAKGISAWLNTFADENSLVDFASRLEEVMKVTVREYPKAIEAIKDDFGFHLENGGYEIADETERFLLVRILPNENGIEPRSKPILIIPPYVMGPNILAFLPGEQRSYVHCYANQGIPTYIRLVKDIGTTPAVQTMTGEDDALDIRHFCHFIKAKHGRPVTLNGFCQGGLQTISAILSGQVDGIVDALITCVTPVDGSRGKSLSNFLGAFPKRFRDLDYSLKKLPNGNTVIDGEIMSWVYKLRSLDTEGPIPAFHRDLAMFDGQPGPHPKISRTATGIMQWLINDKVDIPVAITQMSFDSYTIPIDSDGNLPFTLFGRKLNLKRIAEKKIPWLICIARNDDLVDKEASLAPLDYIDAEVCIYPKGHASLATSWCTPDSKYPLHCCTNGGRGPVRFQLDQDELLKKRNNGKNMNK